MMQVFSSCFSSCFSSTPKVSLIHINGKISNDFGIGFKEIKNQIDSAFNQSNLKAVCLMVNSPGGSAVQSEMIAEYIRFKSDKKNVPVFCFVEDLAASGGYLVACAADLIFVSRFSMVGSIGVITTSFSLEGLMEMLGIQQKVYVSGSKKGGMNPFGKASEEDELDIQNRLQDIHQEFIKYVEERRLGKIKEEHREELFSGAVFGAEKGIEMGLADGMYNVWEEIVAELTGEMKFEVVEIKKKGSGWINSLIE